MIVSMGFIDTLTYYDWKRAVESGYKNIKTKRQATIQPPNYYSARMELTFDGKFVSDTVCCIEILSISTRRFITVLHLNSKRLFLDCLRD